MTTGTLSFNEIASIMGLTRRGLMMFCEHRAAFEGSGMIRDIHYARTNKERDRVDEAAFYLWLASRSGYSPNGLPKDRVRQGGPTKTTERQLCNSVDFAAFRKGLIQSGWFEKTDNHILEYWRGNDRIQFMAYYVEEVWGDGLIEKRAYTSTYITGTLRYEKTCYRSYSSFEEFVSKAMANMFDRKSAKLNGLSFCAWALAPVVA